MKIMKTEAKKIRKEIIEIVWDSLPFVCSNLNNGLRVEVKVHEDWLCKNGSIKKKDIMNREKFLIDSVFEGLGIDDKYIFEHTMKKVQSKEEKVIIKIEEIK